MDHEYYVYILSSPSGTLSVGMTGDLKRRILEHKQKVVGGFTKKYNVTRLVYYAVADDKETALAREDQIKGWRRSKKLDLINQFNFKWEDLAADWYDEGG